MIAFAKEALEPEDESPSPLLIACPQVITQQAISGLHAVGEGSGVAELADDDAAKGQQELAMLQRALAHCGLI